MNVYHPEILGINECRWTNSATVIHNSGAKIYHSGRKDRNHYEGVAIIMSKTTAKCLTKWKPYSERLMSARFKTSYGCVIFCQCYAPTNDAKDTEKKRNFRTP